MASITADNAASIVATVLGADAATAYAPSDPRFGVVVIPDETWLGSAYVEYVRIDGIGTRGHAAAVELHTTHGTFGSDDSATDADARMVGVAARIRDAINAVVGAAVA